MSPNHFIYYIMIIVCLSVSRAIASTLHRRHHYNINNNNLNRPKSQRSRTRSSSPPSSSSLFLLISFRKRKKSAEKAMKREMNRASFFRFFSFSFHSFQTHISFNNSHLLAKQISLSEWTFKLNKCYNNK